MKNKTDIRKSKNVETLPSELNATTDNNAKIAVYEQLINQTDTVLDDYLNFAIFLRSVDILKSLQILADAQIKFGDNPWIEDNKARAFVDLEKLHDALMCWEKSYDLAAEQEKKLFLENLSRFYEKANRQISQKISYSKNNQNWEDVLSVLTNYQLQQPHNLYLYLEISIAYRNIGDFINALKILKAAQKHGLKSPWIHDNYARIYIGKGLYQQAISEIKLALELTGSETEIQFFKVLLKSCEDKYVEDVSEKDQFIFLPNNRQLTVLANKNNLDPKSEIELLIDSDDFKVLDAAMFNQPALLNINQLWNSDFELNARFWHNSTKAKNFTFSVNLSKKWQLEQGHTAYLYQPEAKESLELVYDDPMLGELLPVTPGDYYEIGGSFACHRCEAAFVVEFYDHDLEKHDTKKFTMPTETVGGANLKDYFYLAEFICIPEQIRFVRVSLLKVPKKVTATGNDSYFFFTHLFFTLRESDAKYLGWGKNPFQLSQWRQLRYEASDAFFGLGLLLPKTIFDEDQHALEINALLSDTSKFKLSHLLSCEQSHYHWTRFQLCVAAACENKKWDTAVELVEEWLENHPQASENKHLAIINYLNNTDHSTHEGIFTSPCMEALQLARHLTVTKPTTLYGWQWLAQITYALQRWHECLAAYQELVKLEHIFDAADTYQMAEVSEKFYQYEVAFDLYLQLWLTDFAPEALQKLVAVIRYCSALTLSSQAIALLHKVSLNPKKQHDFSHLITEIIPCLTITSLIELMKKLDDGYKQLLLSLPKALHHAETNHDWSTPLLLLEALEDVGLDEIPDWLAVEMIWIAVQLEQSILISDKVVAHAQEQSLAKLKSLVAWQKVQVFNQQFPLLDANYLRSNPAWKQKPPRTLHEFLSQSESKTLSPHSLFDAQWFNNAPKNHHNAQHLLVDFFRQSNDCTENAPAPNPYFDCVWYKKHYLSNNHTQHPLLHYLAHFKQQGVQPHQYFNNQYVRETQCLLDDEEPLNFYLTQLKNGGIHFCIHGFSPSPFFERSFYLAHYPDILAVVNQTGLDPFYHFIKDGSTEGRLAYAWQPYNEFVRHQRLYTEPCNWHTRLSFANSFRYTKGEKAEKAYLAGQKMLVNDLAHRPLISILVPVYQVSPRFLIEMLDSVIAQTYQEWQLCLVDDASKRYRDEIIAIFAEYAQKDSRINYQLREKNGHICNTTNDCLALAKGDYVALLDHDDLLAPDALYEVVSALNENPNLEIIYTDEDKVDEWGVLSLPFYKPDWSPHALLTRMYVCHLTVYRKALVDSVNGFRVGFEGSQDYDLLLRCSEKTQHIHHIPRVLYHWRAHAESTAAGGNNQAKDYCADAGRKAVAEALQRRGIEADVSLVENAGTVVEVKPKVIGNPLVDIIIPSRNGASILETCLESIFAKTTYQNFKITLIDNNSTDDDFFELVEYWQQQEPERFQVVLDESPFNFARLNNSAAQKTTGEFLLFLNNDTEVIVPQWLDGMIGYAQLPEVGAVGAKLYYEDDTIQHAGVAIGIGAVAGHILKHSKRDDHGYMSYLKLVTNYSAVTAACLMIGREKFNAVGGFTEHLKVAFNDIDFCLKVRQKNLYNVYLPFVELYHYESKSRGYEDTPEKEERFEQETLFMRQRWGKLLDKDPFYSPWLSLDSEQMQYRFH